MNIKIFASQVRQLILQLRKLKQQNADLEAMVQKLKEENVKQHITLNIHDTVISIMVPQEDEAKYREAGVLINERLNTYFNYYKDVKSNKEIYFYAMIDIALKYINESKRNDTKPILNVLEELNKEIEESLK